MGANLTLKFLGEAQREIATAVAISPPFNLRLCANALARGFSRAYDRNFLTDLQAHMQKKAAQLEGLVDMRRVLAAKTLYEFDDACTAPLHGFRDAEDYYTQNSSHQFLATITPPTLIIRAVDDPFFDPADIPHALLQANPALHAALPAHGGHIGFAEGGLTGLRWWANEEATAFLAAHLHG